jgi:hypothetical protein
MLPAGVVDRVDSAEETVYVNRTKDEIKDAPEFDESRYGDEPYREELGGYYGRERAANEARRTRACKRRDLQANVQVVTGVKRSAERYRASLVLA